MRFGFFPIFLSTLKFLALGSEFMLKRFTQSVPLLLLAAIMINSPAKINSVFVDPLFK